MIRHPRRRSREIVVAAALALGFINATTTGRAEAAYQCDPGGCVVFTGAIQGQFQQGANLCWAASLAMIFTAEGHPISQESIVTQVYGPRAGDVPGGAAFERILDRTWTDANGRVFQSHSSRIGTMQDAIRVLNAGYPILYTTQHHAMVQTSLRYSIPQLAPLAGDVFDPLTGQRPMNQYDFQAYAGSWLITAT